MSKSKIGWTEQTWNPITGCTKISPGCDNCYAESMAVNRLQKMSAKYKNGFDVTLHPDSLNEPLKRQKPTIFFVCSMGDIFHKDVPFDFTIKIYSVMARCPQHTFIILTKRAERMAEFVKTYRGEMPNVWHGVTVEDQQRANERIPHLLEVSTKRFLSVEPLVGKIDLDLVPRSRDGAKYFCDPYKPTTGIHQIILGGESGKHARPMHPAWIRLLRDQSALVDIPFYFKQWGEYMPFQDATNLDNLRLDGKVMAVDSPLQQFDDLPAAVEMIRVGKNQSGRIFDGKKHDDLAWRR